MAGGLIGLLDDVAALAKLAAASVDDVGAAAGRASAKAAGVVVDDTAVTPTYVHGLAAKRELPIIRSIATGSIRNKIVFILPVALLLSSVAPVLVEIILMAGGTFLGYEGVEKILHKLSHGNHAADVPAAALGPDHEAQVIAGATRTDAILSAEIMVIALKEVIDEPVLSRAIILAVVAIMITVLVYGVVALIVKMDDVGLMMVERGHSVSFGRFLVTSMPKLLTVLSVVGTAAMLWVGGHILLVGADELGWHWPYEQVHHLEERVHDVALGGLWGWLINTLISALIGVIVGFVVVQVVSRVPFLAHSENHEARDDHDEGGDAAAHDH